MNLSQLKRTITTDLRRAIHILPATVLYTLLFLLVSLVVIKNGEQLFFNPNQYEKVPVGLIMSSDSTYGNFGMKLMEDMKSFRETLDIREMASAEEGYQALKENTITALIIIPDDFVNSIIDGKNAKPVRIVFQNNDTLEEHIINDLLLAGADMLGTSQAIEFALKTLNSQLPIDQEAASDFTDGVTHGNLTYVLARDELFESRSFDDLTGLPLTRQLAGSYSLLVLCLLCFILTAFYQGKKHAYVIRQRGCGLKKGGILISEWISTVFLLYASFLIIFTGLLIAGLSPKFTALALILPILMLIGAFILLLAYSARNPVYSNLIILIGIILLMYLSGGLIPIEFLPKFLQDIAAWNPVAGMIRLMQNTLF